MPLVDVRHVPPVALSFMNDDHHLEACLMNEVAEALEQHRAGRVTAGAVLARFDALVTHTREHFAREEAAMEEAAFPAYAVHKAEHDRVLDEVEAEARAFHAGDAARLWRYVTEAMPAWFAQHVQTMDLVTSRYLAFRAA